MSKNARRSFSAAERCGCRGVPGVRHLQSDLAIPLRRVVGQPVVGLVPPADLIKEAREALAAYQKEQAEASAAAQARARVILASRGQMSGSTPDEP